jgi:lipopolysaccharide transport system permease protein
VTVDILELDASPAPRLAVLRDLWGHRSLLRVMARTDFQVRYKRAVFGVVWAVAVPLLQAAVLAFVFSKVFGDRALSLSDDPDAVAVSQGVSFPVYVLSGIVAWSYMTSALTPGSTAIVDGSSLADKVWFPRALLPIVPVLSSLVGLGASTIALVVLMPILDTSIGPRILLLVPAIALLVSFTMALTLVLAALHVYFRDVRYLVTATLLVWFYVTPIFYPPSLLHDYRHLLDANPMTGIVTLFHMATVDHVDRWVPAVTVSVLATLALLVTAVEVYRRHDRLFVDRL